jgi:hypothetical protein
VSLLLQIPFFMAAYNFLSNLAALRGVSFGPIADLAAADGMLTVAGITVNVMPILMTVINLISGVIYSRDMPLKSKIQMYGITLVFLVLLYRSPAGLVLYWTLNNVFSLCKNILYKLPQPKRILRIACSAAGIVLGIFFIVRFNQYGTKKAAFGIGAAIVLQIPMAAYWIKRRFVKESADKTATKSGSARDHQMLFYTCCILLTVLTGLLIPSAVIHASPAEFVEVGAFRSPLDFVLHAFLLAAGTFLIWCVIYYMLMDEKGKKHFSLIFAILSVAALVNYMFFGNNYGNMSSTFVYDTDIGLLNRNAAKLVNTAVILAVGGAICLLWKKKRTVLRIACILICLIISGMSLANIISVGSQIPEIRRLADQLQASKDQIICLDKNGKNVVVLMLDRAIGYYAPFIFEEKPELKEQFHGFVCYTNTLSYGSDTNTGTPALFGGYEYTPDRINQRSDVLLKDKQNEALKLMPVNFLEKGFKVTVCDPPYANYQWIPDLSIYSDYPEIRTFITELSIKNDSEQEIKNRKVARERNLFCHSIFRVSPVLIHSELYDEGNYNKTDAIKRKTDGGFSVLTNLSRITHIQEDGENTFLMMANHTTHNPLFFLEPDYTVTTSKENNRQYDLEHPDRTDGTGRKISLTTNVQLIHYQTNMAALLRVGKWLNYLRENDVYDHTRIIIVSDHANNLGYSEMNAENANINIGYYNPLLMVKDFAANEEFDFSDEFMTNADTPTIAFSGLVQNPVNPFSKESVTNDEKKNPKQIVCRSPWNITNNHGCVFADSRYFTVENHEVLNPENWSEVK